MPTSGIDLYHMQDARNNFDAMRPAPICADANQFMGQCQNIHISTNCYYGFHDQKNVENGQVNADTDCEMAEVSNQGLSPEASASPQSNARKRSADDDDSPMTKRFREEYKLKLQQNGLQRLPAVTYEAQCDEVRLYFRGYGAIDFKLQPMFTSPNPQQSRYISLSHEVQREKSNEPETNEKLRMDARQEDLTETLYWNIHGGNMFHLIQCL